MVMKRGDDFFLFRNKRGQVAVFIIIAVLIVGLALVVFFLRPGAKVSTPFQEKNPNGFIQSCLQDKIAEAVNLTSLQGGSINPESYILYKGDKIEYLCYSSEYYKLCAVQQPALTQHIQSEVKNYILSDVTSCFSNLKKSYQEQGYDVKLEGTSDETQVQLLPKKILVTFNYTLTTTKGDTKRYNTFNVVLDNNLYELVGIANSIIDFESTYGDADTGIYMTFYPDLKVQRFVRDDGSKVYVLTDRQRGNKFQLASRSLVWPPGYGVAGVSDAA